MTRRTILYILAASAFLVVLAVVVFSKGALLLALIPGTHTVIYDGAAFSPSKITVHLGDTVTFVNKSSEPFWPASNLHPSHLIYPAFDPQKTIPAGGSWSFMFTKAGDWGYHNHVKPIVTGTVSVLDANGHELNALDCTLEANKQNCWEKQIEDALDTGGINTAFDVLANLYQTEPGFKDVCHDMTHKIGEKAYTLFSNNVFFPLSDKTTYCGYGFFHGFMQTLLDTSGSIDEARNFCTFVNQQLSANSPHAWDACYHGIGHGAIDGGDKNTWGNPEEMIKPALALCSKVAPSDNLKLQCGAGVFNALAIAYTDGSYDLHIEPEHMYDLCPKVTDPLYKQGCYTQMNLIAEQAYRDDPMKKIALMGTITEPQYKIYAIRTLMGSYMQPDMTDAEYNKAIEACYSVFDQLRTNCFQGSIAKLLEYGPIGNEYSIGLVFCELPEMKEPERSECFKSVINATEYIHSPKEVLEVCQSIASKTDIKKIPQCNPS